MQDVNIRVIRLMGIQELSTDFATFCIPKTLSRQKVLKKANLESIRSKYRIIALE